MFYRGHNERRGEHHGRLNIKTPRQNSGFRKKNHARDRAQRLLGEAEEELALLPDTPARETLRASLGYVLERRR